jgi:sporulation protein YqfC
MTRVVMYGPRLVHIDGYKSIVSFDDEVINLKCQGRLLEISGNGLVIDSFTGIEMEIMGNIFCVRWLD